MAQEIEYIHSVYPLSKKELQSLVGNAEFSENVSKFGGEYSYKVNYLPKIVRKAKRILK
jgi:hypothetical protein